MKLNMKTIKLIFNHGYHKKLLRLIVIIYFIEENPINENSICVINELLIL